MFYIMTVAIAKHYGFDGWLFNIECEFFPFPTSPKFKAEELAKYHTYNNQIFAIL